MNKRQKIVAYLLLSVQVTMAPGLYAQCTFSSGSTGADGVFNPTNSMPSTGWSINNNVVTVTNTSNGVFNFTSIYVETNWVVKFTKNALNTPVYLLAQSNAVINGSIDLSGTWVGTSGDGGIGGPGGFDGGAAIVGYSSSGFGPGASDKGHAGFAVNGNDAHGPGGPAYGVIDIRPFIGGSGGYGLPNGSDTIGYGGGGGGGALLIAASGTLSCNGTISAQGARGRGHGSGGAIRLMAYQIDGEGLIKASSYDGSASSGRIRIEACVNNRLRLCDPPAAFGPPGLVSLSTNPTIRVTAIAGQNTPWPPSGLLSSPDVYLSTNFANPAIISVAASNVNPGTTFKVIIAPAYGTNIVATNTLVGTYAFSTNSVTVEVYTDRVWKVNALIDYIPRP